MTTDWVNQAQGDQEQARVKEAMTDGELVFLTGWQGNVPGKGPCEVAVLATPQMPAGVLTMILACMTQGMAQGPPPGTYPE